MYILDTNMAFGGATTQYTGFNINSMAKVGENKYLAASESGLFLFGANQDNLVNIQSYFITATMDFGINKDKHIRHMYLTLESTGNLQLLVNTEKVASQSYTITVRPGLGQQECHVILSRSLYGRFWTFKIGNSTTGVDFSIDEISVLPIARTLDR